MRFNIQFKMLAGYLLVVLMVSVGSLWSIRILEQTWDDQAALGDVRAAEESLRAFTGLSGMLVQLERLRQKALAFDPPDDPSLEPGDRYADSFSTLADEIGGQLEELRSVLERVDDSPGMSESRVRMGTRGMSPVLRSIRADFSEYRRQFRIDLDQPPTEAEPDAVLSMHLLVESISLRINDGLVAPVEQAQLYFAGAAGMHRDKSQKLVAVLPLVPGIFAMLISFLISRRIANPIRELRRAIERIARGDFTGPIKVQSRDEVGDLARAMNRMSQRLAELDEMKSGFLFNVSHELKTPLTSIKEAAALLQEEVPGSVNEKQHRLLEIISAETRILIGMIIDLLDLARMEAGRMGYRIQRISPGVIVRRAVDELQFMAQRRGVTLTVDEAPQLGHLFLDGEKMVNAVKNLVNNAVKFSPRDGEVLIRAKLAPPSSEIVGNGQVAWSTAGPETEGRVRAPSVLISVSDQGPGIPEADLPLVFEKFFQSERRNDSKVKGTGLGLAIVRHVAEAHGGSVAVRSAPEKGSTFSISLPLPAGAGERERLERRLSEPMKV